MSSIVRKIDEVVHPERATGPTGTHHNTTATTGVTGTHHNAGVRDTHHTPVTGTHTGGVTGTHHTTAAHHGVAGTTGTTANEYARNMPGPAPNTAGPHSSDLLNKLDPRVDSDMSNPQTRAAHAAQTGGPGPASHTAGPHKSNLVNKLDPTVDSDMSRTGGVAAGTEGVRTYGTTTNTHASAGPRLAGESMGHTGTYGEGYTAPATGHYGAGANTTGRHTGGYTGIGTGGGQAPEGTYGPHSSRIANAADPRVDSDRDNRAALGQGEHHRI